MAMTSRLLLLRRGDHDSRLTEGFESLLDMESMTDVTITCGQHIVKAHRTVLSIFSPFFKRLFDSIQNPMHYPLVVLKDMPYADLRAIIDLMYRGEVTVAQDQFGSLKQSAKTLEVSELSDIIRQYEQKNDIKPKLEDTIPRRLPERNSRKRGRPKRYCEEESDEELKIFPTTGPPTKRQQVLLNKVTQSVVRKPFVQTIGSDVKQQTATRGGVNLTYTRQSAAIRGANSAFQRPQTATRGGTAISATKTPTATRGMARPVSRGRGFRFAPKEEEEDEDYVPSLENSPRRSSRGRRGRPRNSTDLPMATSLPVSSLPEPIQTVDLANIFPNYNPNAVTSSTSNVPNISIPVIKREVDSDSEVECIMSASSPLPSGVVEDITDSNDVLQTSCNEVSADSQTIQTTVNESSNNELLVQQRDSIPELTTNESIATTSNEPEVESNIIQPNIVIKTERPDSPVIESSQIEEQFRTQESAVSSARSDAQNTETLERNITPEVITTSTSQSDRPTESVAVTAPTVISLNTESRDSNVPIIRFIKSERISPPNVQSFHSIALSTNETEVVSNTNEPEVSSDSTIPVLTRVKIERISPKSMENNVIDISEENSQATNGSDSVTSSRVNDSMAQNICDNQSPEESNEVEITYSLPTHTLQQIKVERRTPTQDNDQQSSSESVTQNTECTSSSGHLPEIESTEQLNQQIIVENSDENVIDVQNIAFDCFYSNDDQPMQTFRSEATTSSVDTTTTDVNSLFGSTINQTIDSNDQNNEQMISTSVTTTQSIIGDNINTNQLFSFNTNTSTAITDQTVSTYSMDTNVVMNSPIHSDEECMLLDSPQHPGYEVTISCEPNLDDSMDDRL